MNNDERLTRMILGMKMVRRVVMAVEHTDLKRRGPFTQHIDEFILAIDPTYNWAREDDGD